MKNLHTIGVDMLRLIIDILLWCVKTYVNAQLKFDRKVLKRYFGIETPLYRLWHAQHVKDMQRELDYAANVREGYERGMIF